MSTNLNRISFLFKKSPETKVEEKIQTEVRVPKSTEIVEEVKSTIFETVNSPLLENVRPKSPKYSPKSPRSPKSPSLLNIFKGSPKKDPLQKGEPQIRDFTTKGQGKEKEELESKLVVELKKYGYLAENFDFSQNSDSYKHFLTAAVKCYQGKYAEKLIVELKKIIDSIAIDMNEKDINQNSTNQDIAKNYKRFKEDIEKIDKETNLRIETELDLKKLLIEERYLPEQFNLTPNVDSYKQLLTAALKYYKEADTESLVKTLTNISDAADFFTSHINTDIQELTAMEIVGDYTNFREEEKLLVEDLYAFFFKGLRQGPTIKKNVPSIQRTPPVINLLTQIIIETEIDPKQNEALSKALTSLWRNTLEQHYHGRYSDNLKFPLLYRLASIAPSITEIITGMKPKKDEPLVYNKAIIEKLLTIFNIRTTDEELKGFGQIIGITSKEVDLLSQCFKNESLLINKIKSISLKGDNQYYIKLDK